LKKSTKQKLKDLSSQAQMSFPQAFAEGPRKFKEQPSGKKLRFHMDQNSKKYLHCSGNNQSSERGLEPKKQTSAQYQIGFHDSPSMAAARGSTTTVNRKSILKNSSAKKRFGFSPGSQISRRSLSRGSYSNSSRGHRALSKRKGNITSN
jgi:hypothetical protein